MSGWIPCLAGISIGGAIAAAEYAVRRARVRRRH